MKMDTQHGLIGISNHLVAAVAGAAASACFGVRGMVARSPLDGLFHLLKGEKQTRGVELRQGSREGLLDLDLHVALDSGVNIRATCRTLRHQVRYRVEQTCGMAVGCITVYVETVKA